MSRLFEALRQLESGNHTSGKTLNPTELLDNVVREHVEIKELHSEPVNISPKSRLVALSDPKCLGAEKFRALAMRLKSIREQHEVKSLQVTSSVNNEGKSLVAANLALTLAKQSSSRILLVEGDLHRPTLASLFGLNKLKGVTEWWSDKEEEMTNVLCQLNNMPLWFLSAGKSCEQPSHILQSDRFAKAFSSLTALFEWIVVDSTPMLPVVDANIWSRLVDGTLLVVREGVAPVMGIKKGLESLDNPKLIGIVLNESSEGDQVGYGYSYYGYEVKGKKRS